MGETNPKFWQFKNINANKGELLIYGPISEFSWWGDEVTPKQFADDLKEIGDVSEIDVRINSGGGDVFAAQAIHSLLKAHKATVHVHIDGLAASAATIIAMAGDTVYIPANAMMMIHNPLLSLWGMYNTNDFQEMSSVLEKVKESIISAYQAKTGLPRDELSQIMDDETWLTGQEAVDKGFANVLLNSLDVSASLKGKMLVMNGLEHDMSRFNRVPVVPNEPIASNPVPTVPVPQQPPVVVTNHKPQEGKVMDVNTLKNEYPAIYNEVFNTGVTAERQRFQAIDDIAMPGNEEIVNKAKYETGISAEQLAIDLIKAEKQRGSNFINNRQEDAQGVSEVPGVVTPSNTTSTEADSAAVIQNMVAGAKNKRGVR